jgi:hypothetical protein
VIDATTGAKTGYIPTSPIGYDATATWSKDGQRIIFGSKRAGNPTFDLFSTEPVRRGDGPLPAIVPLTTLTNGNETMPAYSR